mmetsp:Transcript_28517/g.72181  ORF Transcript_28517/g.72181 Transcript_28517/m.72181 type:complete len:490 (-) Transcript_28517:2-1471(-)
MASEVGHAARTPEQEMIESLRAQVEAEKKRRIAAEEQIDEMRRRMGRRESELEAEEEAMTNKLMTRITEIEKEKEALTKQVLWEEERFSQEKRALADKLLANSTHLQRLKEEKEALTRQVESEEHTTTVYQHKLSKLLAEKLELEKRLEQEQEYNLNRLQKQLADTQKEKSQLERLLEEEREKVTSVEAQKKSATEKLQRLNQMGEREQEFLSNMLSKTTQGLLQDKAELARKFHIEQQNVAALSKECEMQRQELRKFQGASYVIQQRIIKESQRLRRMTHAKATLSESFEMELERQLNNIVKQQMGVAIDQPPPRPHYTVDSHDSSLPLPEMEGSMEGSSDGEEREQGASDDDDTLGELAGELEGLGMLPFNRRSYNYGETRSLPAFSPRQSPWHTPSATPPWQTPSATPLGSRSHSPINISPSSSRSLSPAQSTRSQSSISSADTLSSNARRPSGDLLGRLGGGGAQVASGPPITMDARAPRDSRRW